MNGILALRKDKGMTSHDCVFKLRKLYQTKKIGHTGTLDPNVEGVLPICIGAATKMVEYLQNSPKTYQGEVTLGRATTTEDGDGDIIASQRLESLPDLAVVDLAMAQMTGPIVQVPPMYSAVKVNGKRLYEYARAGQTVERPQRQVEIYQFKRTSPLVSHEDGTVSFTFEVRCSKGTYVRTLAVDLGAKLGYPAYMSALERTESAGFYSQDCVSLAQLEALDLSERKALLMPIEAALVDYPRVTIDRALFDKVKNGAVLEQVGDSLPAFLVYEGKIVALYEAHPRLKGLMKPKKMLLGNVHEDC